MRAAVARLEAAGGPVRHLGSTLIPDEDAVFSFFAAAGAAEVATMNREADVPFDRVVPAHLVAWPSG